MYQPPHFREERLEVLHDLIEAHPLGLLVTIEAGRIVANPVPFLIERDRGERGLLIAHMARANTQWRDFDPATEAVVVFQGPQAYVTPSWYETKRETGKVVPTWNYAIVEARGTIQVHEDAEWLHDQVSRLTARHEGTRGEPWAVADAPEDFIAGQLRGIVGISIEIRTIEGKWKVSQNRSAADRRAVAAGLRADGDAAMPALVEGRIGDAS